MRIYFRHQWANFLCQNSGIFNNDNICDQRPPSAPIEGSPYREIGSSKNVTVKISKGFKLKFLKRHVKNFHNNIFIFQPYTGLEKFLKIYIYNDFTKKA